VVRGGKNSYKDFNISLTPRKLLQLLGTECGRNIIHPNIWTNSLFADYKGVKAPNGKWGGHIKYPNWIITDVRFPNEAKAIKDRGGIIIRVNRFTEEQKIAFAKTRAGRSNNSLQLVLKNQHPSETALDDYEFDYVVDNNGTLEELIEKIKGLNIPL